MCVTIGIAGCAGRSVRRKGHSFTRCLLPWLPVHVHGDRFGAMRRAFAGGASVSSTHAMQAEEPSEAAGSPDPERDGRRPRTGPQGNTAPPRPGGLPAQPRGSRVPLPVRSRGARRFTRGPQACPRGRRGARRRDGGSARRGETLVRLRPYAKMKGARDAANTGDPTCRESRAAGRWRHGADLARACWRSPPRGSPLTNFRRRRPAAARMAIESGGTGDRAKG